MITISFGIDSNYGLTRRYEYVVMKCINELNDDWEVLKRETGFKSKAQAKSAGLKAAKEFM